MAAIEEVEVRAQERVGTVLNSKWTIDRLIGVGGMAAVYSATHRNRSRVAIKMLHTELSLNRDMRDRFLREGYISNSVEHPGAVHVHDDDVAEDGSAYIVMELIEGESLEVRRIRKGGTLPINEVLSLMDQVLDTLATAHKNGITHRDLKPDNLFLDKSTVVKVLDFGIARLKEMGSTSGATKTGSLLGTPAYMAPEQARGRWKDVDAQTDLWAIGATSFTMITGRLVHEGETVNETLAMAMSERAPPSREVLPEIPEPVAAWLDRSLAYDKADRYPDAASMQDALREAYEQSFSGTQRDVEISIPGASSPVASPAPEEKSGAMAATLPSNPSDIDQVLTAASATTSGGVAASNPIERTVPAKSKTRLIGGGIAAAVALGVLGFFLMGPTDEPVEPAAATSPVPVPAAVEPSVEIEQPAVAPAVGLSLDDLAIDEEEARRPQKTRPKKPAAQEPAVTPESKAAPAPAPKKKQEAAAASLASRIAKGARRRQEAEAARKKAAAAAAKKAKQKPASAPAYL